MTLQLHSKDFIISWNNSKSSYSHFPLCTSFSFYDFTHILYVAFNDIVYVHIFYHK